MPDFTTATEYKLVNGQCELSPVILAANAELFTTKDCPRWIATKIDGGVETNHIFSLGRRPDYWSNLIDLHPYMHRWFHRNLTIGRVACLYVKWLKGGRDWSVPDLCAASGRDVIGWLSTLDLPEPYAMWRTAIVEHPAGTK